MLMLLGTAVQFFILKISLDAVIDISHMGPSARQGGAAPLDLPRPAGILDHHALVTTARQAPTFAAPAGGDYAMKIASIAMRL